jgi:hypothetical protein
LKPNKEEGRRTTKLRDDKLTRDKADISLTNQKPSAIYRLRPHLPPDAPLPTSTPTQAANLGIEIAPLPQLEQLLSTIGGAAEGKGKEVAGKVDVGKVAEKVVKNVRFSISFFFLFHLLPIPSSRSFVSPPCSPWFWASRRMRLMIVIQLPTFLRRRRKAHVSPPRPDPAVQADYIVI